MAKYSDVTYGSLHFTSLFCHESHALCHRLEYDMSWTPLDKRKSRDSDEAMVTKILRANELVGPALAGHNARESTGQADSDFKPLMALLDKTDD